MGNRINIGQVSEDNDVVGIAQLRKFLLDNNQATESNVDKVIKRQLKTKTPEQVIEAFTKRMNAAQPDSIESQLAKQAQAAQVAPVGSDDPNEFNSAESSRETSLKKEKGARREPSADGVISRMLGLGDTPSTRAFSEKVKLRGIGGGRLSPQQIGQIEKRGIKTITKSTEHTRASQNERRISQGQKPIPVNDDLLWSILDSPNRYMFESPILKANTQFSVGRAATTAGLIFLDSASFGVGNYVDALLMATGVTDKPHYGQFIDENARQQEFAGSGFIKGAANFGGFLAPSGGLGLAVKGGSKLVRALGGKKLAQMAVNATTKAAAGPATKAGAKAVYRGANAGTVDATLKALTKAEATALKGATAISKVTTKVLYEIPLKAVGYAGGKILGRKVTDQFIKASSAALANSGIGIVNKIIAKNALGKLNQTGVNITRGVIGRALSETITAAWKSSRGTTLRRLLESGEKDAIENTVSIFQAKVSAGIAKELGEDINSEVVARATSALTAEFRKQLAGGSGKGIDKLRSLLTAPLGMKGPKMALVGEHALDLVEHSVAMGVHSQVVTFNAMLGQSLMALEASDDDHSGLNPFEKGKLYLGTTQDFYNRHRETEPAWMAYAFGGVFGTGLGLKYLPSSTPVIGQWMNRSSGMGLGGRLGRIINGPKIDKGQTFKILEKELMPAHEQIIEGARTILGIPKGMPLNAFYHNLSLRAAKTELGKNTGRVSKRIFDKFRGMGKKPESMENQELAATGAMMRSLRERFGSARKAGREGSVRQGGSHKDQLGFDDIDLQRLANPQGVPSKLLNEARNRVIGALEAEQSYLWARYRGAHASELVQDLGVTFARALPVFAATGGVGMVSHMIEDGPNEESVSNLLLHAMMSMWAVQAPRFENGVHLSPAGWHKGRKLVKTAEELPGWTDARIELGALERELFYMGAGGTDFTSGQGARATGITLEGINPIVSEKALVDKFNASALRVSQEQAVLAGVGREPAGKKFTAVVATHPGAATDAIQQEADSQGRQLRLVSLKAQESAMDFIRSVAANGIELGDIFNINGLNPSRDGREWEKAMNEDATGLREQILSMTQHAIHDAFGDFGVQGSSPDDFTFIPMVSALNAGSRKTIVKIRGDALEMLTALRTEQLQGAVDLKSGQQVDRFRFPGPEHSDLNERANNLMDIGARYELAVGHISAEDGFNLGAGKVSGEKSMFDVAAIMSVEGVTDIVDRFDARLIEGGFHKSLNLLNPETKNVIANATERVGRSLAGEMFASGGRDQPLPILESQEGIATKQRALEIGRAQGLLGWANGKYVVKKVADDVMREFSYNKQQEIKSLLYIYKSLVADVFIPSDKFMESNDAIEHFLVSQKSQLRLWSPHHFEASTHKMTGPLPRFTMPTGVVGMFNEIGIPLHSYHYIQGAFGELMQHDNALITDIQVATLNLADQLGQMTRTEKGWRVKPIQQLITRDGAEVLTKGTADHSITSIFDALRGSYGDESATGDLVFRNMTTDLLIEQARDMYRQIFQKEMTGVQLMDLKNQQEYRDLEAYNQIMQGLIDIGKIDGWATSNNKIDGVMEEAVVQASGDEGALEMLRDILNPLADAADAKDRREMMRQIDKKMTSSAFKNPTQIKEISWMHKRLQTIFSFNNPRAMKDLQYLFQNTGALRLTQKNGRKSATLNLDYLDKGNNLKLTIEKLELMEFADIGAASVHERFRAKEQAVLSELQEKNPVQPEHKFGNKMADIFSRIGLGFGNEMSHAVMRHLFVASRDILKMDKPDLNDIRSAYIPIFVDAIRMMTSEGIDGDNIYISGPTNQREMLDAVNKMTDNELLAVLHNTSNMVTYREITPGAVTIGANTSVKSTNRAGDVEISASSVSVSAGNARAEIKTRSRGPIDKVSEALGGIGIHVVKDVNSQTGENILTNEAARTKQFNEWFEIGIIGLSQSDNPTHMVGPQGEPIRLAVTENVLGANAAFEIPKNRAEMLAYSAQLKKLNKLVTHGEDEQSAMIVRAGEMAKFLDSYIKSVDDLPDNAIKNYNLYHTTLAKGEGSFSLKDINNIHRMLLRLPMFGEGGMDAAVRSAGVKNAKRMTQYFSNSAQRSSVTAVHIAINKMVRDIGNIDGERAANEARATLENMTSGTGDGLKWRTMMVSESPLQEFNGVEGLDGNIMVHPLWARAHAELLGFDSTEDVYGQVKGFHAGANVIDGVVQNVNNLTKALYAVPSPRMVKMMEQLGVAMAIPKSSMKIGAGGLNFTDVNLGGELTNVHTAAWQVGLGVNVARLEENVLEIGAGDFNFQTMPHPKSNGYVASGQMASDWHPKAVADFVGDQGLFPIDRFIALGRAVMGEGDVNTMALARALMTKKDLNPNVAYGDLYARKASLLDTILAQSRDTSPSVFFRKPLQSRVFSLVRDGLFKGQARTGSKATLIPNENNAQDTGEMYKSFPSMRTPTDIDTGKFGVKPIRRIIRDANGKIMVDNGKVMTEPYTPEMASADQSRRMEFQEGADNFYNIASVGIVPIEGRLTTWNDFRLLGKANAKEGIRDSAISSMIESWYAGGVTGVESAYLTPLQALFNEANVPPESFDKAIEIVTDVVNAVFSNPNVGLLTGPTGVIAAEGDKLKLLLGNSGAVGGTEPSNNSLIDNFVSEVSTYLTTVLHDGTKWGGLNQPYVGDGHITEGNIKALYDTLFGDRKGPTANHLADAYNKDIRQRDVDGITELAGNRGKTPVAYGQSHVVVRSPLLQPNDRVIARNLAFLDVTQGDATEINRIDGPGVMQADNDGDKINIANGLPHGAFAEVLRNRNIMGAFGDQKSTIDNSGFTYIVRDGVNENLASKNGNRSLQLIKDKQTAAVMKGSLISAKSAVTQVIADELTMSYTDIHGAEYTISPAGNYNEVMGNHLSSLIQVISKIQSVLDSEGNFLPEELKGMNMDHEVFGPLMKKMVKQSDRPAREISRDLSAQGSRGALSDTEYAVLGVVRRVYTDLAAITGDDFSGGEGVSKTPAMMIDQAMRLLKIVNGGEAGMKKHIVEELEDLGYYNDDLAQVLKTLKITSKNNKLFATSVAEWIVLIGKAMEGPYPSNKTGATNQGQRALALAVGETAVLEKMRRVIMLPEVQQYAKYVQEEKAKENGTGPNTDRYKLTVAQIERIKKDEAAMLLKVYEPTGSELVEMRRNNSEGLAFFVTLITTPQTLFGDVQDRADGFAGEIIQKRDASWAQMIGQKAGKSKTLSTNQNSLSIHQAVLDGVVRNFLETFRSENGSNLHELMIQLIEPQRMGQYAVDGSAYFTYKPMRQDLVTAIMNYDPDAAISLMTRINENAIVAFESSSTGSLRVLKELNELVTDQTSWQGRIGEFRSVLRNKMDWTGMTSPLTDQMLANADKAPQSSTENEFGDYIASGIGGQQLIAKNELLKSAIRTAREIESNPVKRMFMSVRPSKRVALDMVGLNNVMPHRLDAPMEVILRQPQRLDIENSDFWKDTEASYRNDKASDINERNDKSGPDAITGKFKPRVKPDEVTLNRTDLDKIKKEALERTRAQAIKQAQVMGLIEHLQKGRPLTDFDNGTGPRLMEAEIKTREGAIAEQTKRNRDKCKDGN